VQLAVSKNIVATAVGNAQMTRRLTPGAAYAATAIGVAAETLQARLNQSATAVGVAATMVARVQLQTAAATAVGVADVTVTFIPFTPAADPDPTSGAKDRTLLVRLSKFLWG
jgi:hypothetical protein